jgi:serine protease AprX
MRQQDSTASCGTRASALWGRGGRSAIAFCIALFAVLGGAAPAPAKGEPGKGKPALDVTPPITTIKSSVKEGSTVQDSSLRFDFRADEPATFACAVDGTAFGPCSGKEYHVLGALEPGGHSFQVRATDRAGNVELAPPGLTWNVAYKSSEDGASTSIPNGLYKQAKSHPFDDFRVIVQVRDRVQLDPFARKALGLSGGSKIRKVFRSIDGVAATLQGWLIVYVAEHPTSFATVSISEDRPVALMDAHESQTMWPQTVEADSLWDRQGVECQADAVTGLQLDPTCAPLPAFLAPQAPTIAIVDSGIQGGRADDFGARVLTHVNFSSLEPDLNADGSGHGTMVAGVAAGASAFSPGVAQNAPLVDVRVASSHGQALTSDIIAGLDWILANKDAYNIRVANLSLAGTSESSFLTDPLDKAVEKLWFEGIVVVAAAGNHGEKDKAVKIPSPANDPFVITVGALDVNGTTDPSDDFRTEWSAYGPTADGFSKPDLAAPGRALVMPVPTGAYIPSEKPDRVVAPGYMWMSGTSFAAPVVAGLAAQILARNPGLTPDQVKGALMATASPLSGQGATTGVGEVDGAAAVAADAVPNPNENLYAFVANGEFDGAAWMAAVTSDSTWSQSNWTEANWTEANWTEANWTSANWTEANWTEANWTAANWVE